MTGVLDNVMAHIIAELPCRSQNATTINYRKSDFNRGLITVPISDNVLEEIKEQPQIKSYLDYRRQVYSRRLHPIHSQLVKLSRMEWACLRLFTFTYSEFCSVIYNLTLKTITNHHFRKIYVTRKRDDLGNFIESYEDALKRMVDTLLEKETKVFSLFN